MTRVGNRIKAVRARMQQTIPYGPLAEHLEPNELRARMNAVDPNVKQGYIDRVGDEEWRRIIQDINGGR